MYAIQMLGLFTLPSTQIVKTKICAVVEGMEDPSESNIAVHSYEITS